MSEAVSDIEKLSPRKLALYELLLKKKQSESVSRTRITTHTRESDSSPLSFAQQRLWLMDQLEPGNAMYNSPVALRLTGWLDITALERTLSEIIRRHEVLRTTFSVIDDRPAQVIAPPAALTLAVVDVSELPEEEREADARRLAAEEAQRPFNLSEGPLLRASLVRLGAEEHIALFTLHHIISDAWSTGIFVREVGALYEAFLNGRPSPLPELPIQYADFAVWQHEWLQEKTLAAEVAYWRNQLAGAPPVLELPTDRPRPAVQTHRGAVVTWIFPESLTNKLKELSKHEGFTLFMTLLAAFNVLLYRYTGQRDIVVGTPIAGRNHSEVENLIGFFINTLVLRTKLAGESSFRTLLGQVREVALEAYAHQELPFEKLVEELNPERSMSHAPVFQVMFGLQNVQRGTLELPGLTLAMVGVENKAARADLGLNLIESESALVGNLQYNTDLFDEATVRRMATHFEQLLTGVVEHLDAQISQLTFLTQQEKEQQLVQWNDTAVEYPRYLTLYQLIEAQAATTPDAIALVYEDEQVTYSQLNERANQVAHYLRENGVGLEMLVGLCFERSIEMVVALLGVVKAGGAYVPLDPRYPLERLSMMIEDSGISVLLTQERLAEVVQADAVRVMKIDTDWGQIEERSGENLTPYAGLDNLAYVIYTSGSTGRPKGTLITHRGLWNLSEAQRQVLATRPEDRVLQFSSLSFDASIFEIVWALGVGATLCLATQDELAPGDALLKLLREESVTMAVLPPTALATLKPEMLPELRTIMVAGEACPAELIEQWSVGRRFFNGYGPTEATVWATMSQCFAGAERVTIGRPIANAEAYILDRDLQLLPAGVTGELYICGPGLARGYLRRPDLTAERFVPHPFSSKAGARLYKTGDLVRHLPDGNMEFIGRVDEQVKVRGFRIELGEIEYVLGAHEAVSECVIVVREDAPGDKRLVAYIVSDVVAEAVDSGRLRAYLKERLPEYMVPAAFVILAELPLTPNGKIDRKGLPIPEQNRSAAGPSYVAARTPVEEVLCGMWEQVLRVERVGVYDNFFELGGHSLLATQIISRLKEAFQVEVPLRRLFEAPTVAEFSEIIQEAMQKGHGLLVTPIEAASRDGNLPLSFAQQRLWFVDQLEGGHSAYNIPAAIRLRGPLNVTALAQTLSEVVRRHEILRTTLPLVDGQPVQVISPPQPIHLPVVNLSELPEAERESKARQLSREEAQSPFDLINGPLLRASLLRLSEDEHIALFTMHHIISDGWSMSVLVHEVSTLYTAFSAGEASALPELQLQYADFAVWQRGWFKGEVLETQLAYWKQQLAGAPAALDLPTDRPRPAVQTYRGALQPLILDKTLTSAIKQLARSENATLFMAFLAAFQSLLHRYTGSNDIVVGTDIANRNRGETEKMIGFFVNQLVIRTDMSGNPTFKELLGRVRETTLEAYTHQDLPFDKLVEVLNPGRDLSRTPLFQVKIIIQNTPREVLKISDLELSRLSQEAGVARFDLVLNISDTVEGVVGTVEYNTDLFDASTIKRMVNHFRMLLESAAADPERRLSQLSLLSKEERDQQLVEWNETSVTYSGDTCVHRLFESRVAASPLSLALCDEVTELSYGELNQRANQLARHLRTLGVRAESRVALCLPRSIELVIAMLAVLKAGGCYVPLDPDAPLERLSLMLADAQAVVVVTSEEKAEELPSQWAQVVLVDSERAMIEQESGENLSEVEGGDTLAYLIYTSGSTGVPKGVAVTHRGLSNLVHWHHDAYHLTMQDRGSLVAGIGFDASAWELWPYLASGASLLVVSAERVMSQGLLEWLDGQSVTVCFLPTPLAEAALWQGREQGWGERGSIRAVLTGGDRLRQRPAEGTGFTLVNHYGPTECTVVATSGEVKCGGEASSAPPIGRPIWNTQVYVLDTEMQLVPVGVMGELYIGGEGLARGYWHRPQQTAERFVPHPFSIEPGARLYRTGDVVRYRADGNLEFVGRGDEQVKLRGFRIELGEIESVLGAHASVRECVVIAREDVVGDKRLVAYVVGDEAHAVESTQLRAYLKERLPDYMVPSSFVMLKELPLTPNGKVDRKALPEPDISSAELMKEAAVPGTEVEELLAGMWAHMLGRQQVGIDENFFELGGHSLLATRLISEIKKAFHLELPLRNIFEAPTVAELAEVIETAKRAVEGIEVLPIKPVPRDIELPLSFAQQRLWFMDQLEPGSSFYNNPCVMRLKGKLDIEALERGVNEICRRHEVLRTVYPMVNGQPVQVIEQAQQLQIPITDLTTLSDDAREGEALRLTLEEARRPFDLARGPVIRVGLLRLGVEDHIIHFMMHHITCDAWSLGVLVREITILYDAFVKGEPSPLPEITVQYADYAYWQQNWLRGEVLESEIQYWKRHLGGTLPVLVLPTERPRPVTPTYEGSRHSFKLPTELSESIKQLSWRESVTPFMTLLAAFKLLLHRYTKLDDIIVGTAHANRNHADTENLIGFFINMLVLRTDLSGSPSFLELLHRVREVALDGYMHQDMPFEKIVEEMQLKRDAGNTPIFQVAFGVENARQAAYSMESSQPVDLQGLTMSPVSFDTEVVRYDLTLWVKEGREGLFGWWNYKTSLFDLASIKLIHGHFVTLLQSVIAQPDAKLDSLEMFTQSEKEQQASAQKSLDESKHRRLKAIKPQPVRPAQSDH
jgi:amino acid adenylation domain-containing protein